MSDEKDIIDFNQKADFFESMERTRMSRPIYDMHEKLMERTALYLEFMAAAFLKETGLKASEVELVSYYDPVEDAYHWKYQRRG